MGETAGLVKLTGTREMEGEFLYLKNISWEIIIETKDLKNGNLTSPISIV